MDVTQISAFEMYTSCGLLAESRWLEAMAAFNEVKRLLSDLTKGLQIPIRAIRLPRSNTVYFVIRYFHQRGSSPYKNRVSPYSDLLRSSYFRHLPAIVTAVPHLQQGCLDGMSISVPRGGRECSPRLLIDNQDLVRAFAMVSMAVWHAMRGRSNGGAVDYPSNKTSSTLLCGRTLILLECIAHTERIST